VRPNIASGPPLGPELELRVREFEAAGDAARELFDGLPEDLLRRRPAPDRWSVVECLEHLNVTGAQLLPVLDRGIERARRKHWYAMGPSRYGWLETWFVSLAGRTEGPPRRRLRTPRLYAPGSEPVPSRVLPAFLELQSQLRNRARSAAGLDLARGRLRSPVTPLVRLSLGQWLALTAGHQERHLAQARRVRQELLVGSGPGVQPTV
jgi:hypothetical protein